MNSTAEIVLQQGKYRINHTLDRGEFGITYRATQVQLGQAVAIKTLRPSLRHHPDFAQYYNHFRAVTHRLSQCRQQSLIRILDVFEEKGLPFVVMNYIEGFSLAEKLQSRAPLSVDYALYYVHQIASALKVVHQQGLLHCNLQPQTILQHPGSDGVTLTDFGINSSFIERTMQPYRGNRNLPGGFAALEQYLPHETLTPATDIYGLAAILYYLLTGQPPLEAPLLSSQGTAKWFSQVQPSLKRLHPELSPSVEQMILAGLEVQQSNRPQTIDHWLAFMPSLNSTENSTESNPVDEDEAISTDPTQETVPDSFTVSRSRFLLQFLWLQRCTPILFVLTALFFGWLGFSFTRRYTQMIVDNVHQKFDSKKGADWSEDVFSDYDPSKPMFEDPSVKTRGSEPQNTPGERDSELDFGESDPLDSDYYNSAPDDDDEWDSDWDDNDQSDWGRPSEYNDPDSQRYRTQPEDEYTSESENYNADNSYTNEWVDESNPQLDASSLSDPYDEPYRYDYDREANYNDTSGYSGYTTDLSPDERYQEDWQTPSDPQLEEANSSTIGENETDWNSTQNDPYTPAEASSNWTPESTFTPDPSTRQWPPTSEAYSPAADPVAELSIPESSYSFSEYETNSTPSESKLGLEEISIPSPVRANSY
ncbi:MAG: protein kinase [Microcoleaceae cyanobacterium]